MIIKQSNNIVPVMHRLVTDEYGENYWFNDCTKYVMECLGEKDLVWKPLAADSTLHRKRCRIKNDAVKSLQKFVSL